MEIKYYYLIFEVDRFGRRILVLGSAVVVSISLAALGTFFYLKSEWGADEASSTIGWLPLVSLMVFFAAYSCGFANVPYIIMGEMFPLRYRFLLSPSSSGFSLLCTFAVIRSFPLTFAMSEDGTIWFLMSCTVLSIAFVAIFLPETKGKSLEEIERLFSGNKNIENQSSAAQFSLPSILGSQDDKGIDKLGFYNDDPIFVEDDEADLNAPSPLYTPF